MGWYRMNEPIMSYCTRSWLSLLVGCCWLRFWRYFLGPFIPPVRKTQDINKFQTTHTRQLVTLFSFVCVSPTTLVRKHDEENNINVRALFSLVRKVSVRFT